MAGVFTFECKVVAVGYSGAAGRSPFECKGAEAAEMRSVFDCKGVADGWRGGGGEWSLTAKGDAC